MSDATQPPVPGGDPAQPPPDLPVPTADKDKDKDKGQAKGQDPATYGPIEGREIPAPEGASEPHQIF
jgi:hypothetical protein